MENIKTARTVIDLEKTVQRLMDSVDLLQDAAEMCRAEGPILLRDFRTVGVKVPRQCGKSFEAVQRLIRNEKAIMICINDALRKSLATITHSHPHGEPLKPHQIARMYTVDEVIKAIKSVRNGQQDILLAGANEIIVDDSHWFFQLVRTNQFYQWLWDRQGADQKILLL
jgi:hypothetical protein